MRRIGRGANAEGSRRARRGQTGVTSPKVFDLTLFDWDHLQNFELKCTES
jgi:hypothetical protein